jgi:DNA-binding NtrC family response regulator
LPSKRILVVDDDPSARLMFKLILEATGYLVEEAQNGIAALILIKDAVPDLVVTGRPEARTQASGADFVLDQPFDRSALPAALGSLVGAGA